MHVHISKHTHIYNYTRWITVYWNADALLCKYNPGCAWVFSRLQRLLPSPWPSCALPLLPRVLGLRPLSLTNCHPNRPFALWPIYRPWVWALACPVILLRSGSAVCLRYLARLVLLQEPNKSRLQKSRPIIYSQASCCVPRSATSVVCNPQHFDSSWEAETVLHCHNTSRDFCNPFPTVWFLSPARSGLNAMSWTTPQSDIPAWKRTLWAAIQNCLRLL